MPVAIIKLDADDNLGPKPGPTIGTFDFPRIPVAGERIQIHEGDSLQDFHVHKIVWDVGPPAGVQATLLVEPID